MAASVRIERCRVRSEVCACVSLEAGRSRVNVGKSGYDPTVAGHTKDEIAAFTNGDERMLWAADRVTRRVFYLQDGDADRLRTYTRENLVCVVPDCPTPAITAVARRDGRRQGFRHLTAVAGEGHAMGVFHIQGQAEIVKWLTKKYERSTVALEVPINDNRDRVADVMLTAVSGARVSFEVQYASLNAATWEARHADYLAAGIPDVWLFGHAGNQLKLDRDKNVKLNATHRAVAEQGLHILWFNPLDRMLATVTVPRYFPASGQMVDVPVHGSGPIDSDRPAATLHLFALADASVTKKGFTAPILLELDERLAKAIAQETAAVTAAAKKVEEEVRRQANTKAKLARIQKSHDERSRAWPDHPMRRSILQQFNGLWPKFLDVVPKGEGDHFGSLISTPFPHQQWEAILYLKFIHGKNDRSWVTIKDSTAYLVALDGDNPLAKEAVTMWFHRLLDSGVLVKEDVEWRDGSIGVRYVTRTPKAKQAELKAEAALRAERERLNQIDAAAREISSRAEATRIEAATAQCRLVYQTWADNLASVVELAAAGTPVKDLPVAIAGQGRCPNCYRGLVGQVNIDRGYHLTCAEGIYRSVGRPVPPKPDDYYN
jgi:hypothetical protein